MAGVEEAVVYGHLAAAVGPANESAVVGTVGPFEAAVELTVGERDVGVWPYEGYEAAVGGIATDAAVERHRRAAVLDAHRASVNNPRDEAGRKLLARADGARRVQIANGGIAYIAEGRDVLSIETGDIESQRMSVTVEDTHVGRVLCSRIGVAGDVGKETCIYRFPIGRSYLRAEVVPVVDIAYGHEEFLDFFQIVERRLFLLHKHLHVEADAGSEEIHHLVALLPVGGAEHVAHGVYGDPVAVLRDDAQHHLGAVVPNGATLVGILPGHAHGVGQRVLPLSRVVGYAQQVQIVHHATGGGGAVVAGAPAPVLGDGAAHAVGQVVKRAAVRQYARLHGLH